MEQFLTNDLHRAFRLDALASSHPITVNVEDPEDIKTVFDAITYSKVCGAKTPPPIFGNTCTYVNNVLACKIKDLCSIIYVYNQLFFHFKGSSIIRMLSDFLTEDTFKGGLQVSAVILSFCY